MSGFCALPLVLRASWLSGILFLALLLFFSPVRAGQRDEGWYRDVSPSHWAYHYIRVLWEEDVADGWRSWGGSVFLPDREITRAEFVLMMAKAFRLSPVPPRGVFADVPSSLLLYNRIPAAGWIEAAHRAGVVEGYPDGRFRPHDSTRRDHAVALLIRALGLREEARRLPEGEVGMLLGMFRDHRETDPSVVREMALAVKLKLIIGYPDGTLRPARRLTRAEGATVIYRSAALRLEAFPNPFSPDGDGFEDLVAIRTSSLRNRNSTRWGIVIGSLSGEEFRTFSGYGNPPGEIWWDGRTGGGWPVGRREVYYWGWLWDRQGNIIYAIKKPLRLIERTLTAYLSPGSAPPGGRVTVTARTTGHARSVTARLSGGPKVDLRPEEPPGSYARSWRGELPLPLDLADGEHRVEVEADFGPVKRRRELSLRVVDPLRLECSLQPPAAEPGTTVSFRAAPSPLIVRVRFFPPWRPELTLLPPSWETRDRLPLDLAEGEYSIPCRGETADGRTKEGRVVLTVKSSSVRELQFILDD